MLTAVVLTTEGNLYKLSNLYLTPETWTPLGMSLLCFFPSYYAFKQFSRNVN